MSFLEKHRSLYNEVISVKDTVKAREARRIAYALDPDRIMRQRLNSAVNLLARYGLIDAETHDRIRALVLGGVCNGKCE